MLEGHGDDLHNVNIELKANFSSNVYHGGCPRKLMNFLQENLLKINNYPSPVAHELNVLAAGFYGLNENAFLFTNGATEAFYLLGHVLSGKTASIVVPTFSEYEDACLSNDISIYRIEENELENVETDCVFICNPNNPDGKIWSSDFLWSLVQKKPHVHFVIDEAYIEFTKHVTSFVEKTQLCQNLTVVRSLTKTFAIPGLRLGYIISNGSFIQRLKGKKMPWSVNAMAVLAGTFIFHNYATLRFDLSLLLDEKEKLWAAIHALDGLECRPSSTSYFLIKLHHGKASELKEYLLINHQLLVRDATNFKGLEGEYIRVATQGSERNELLINGLKSWSKN